MIREKNIILQGQTGRPIVTDVFFDSTHTPKPIVIFCHGYKGYKDWGAWNQVAEKFAENDFFFIKFNFSHNGGTSEQPIDFPDLEAFAEDNYTKQLNDLETVIDWILTTKKFSKDANVEKLNLVGHSRGGGIVLLKTAENKYVKNVATWAGVSDFESRFPQGEKLKKWKETGVYYVENGRTKQQMPHNIQFYEDFMANEKRLDIQKAVRRMEIPQLIVHAKNDMSVKLEEAEKLHQFNKRSVLELIEVGGHTFGAKHPWNEEKMPLPLKEVCEKTIDFFNK